MNTDKQIQVTFHGGTGSVTGANFLLENIPIAGSTHARILIDCGMYQGGEDSFEMNYEKFAYNPTDIDVLIVTHAHADHIGRIPKLVRDGFRGVIYSTEATYDLAQLMLMDSLKIAQEEAKQRDIEPMYSESDVHESFKLWKHIPYHNPIELPGGFVATLYDAGHILGSSMVCFEYASKKILFTGDLGNSPDPLLKDTEIVHDVDYMIIESVYGDRNHEEREERIAKLKNAITETIAKKGVLMIPSFALERTQNLLMILNDLIESGEIPHIPIFLDSPLGIEVTDVFKKHTDLMNQSVKDRLKTDSDIFDFPGLKKTSSVEESKSIIRESNPKVIISSAGMSHAGRIIHHEKQYLDDPENMLLFVGYQAVGTAGRIIQDGAKKIKLLGKEIDIRAKVETISGYSAHKDSDHLIEFIASSNDHLEQVFVAMGEMKSSLFLVQRIRDYLGVHATAPEHHQSIVLDMS